MHHSATSLVSSPQKNGAHTLSGAIIDSSREKGKGTAKTRGIMIARQPNPEEYSAEKLERLYGKQPSRIYPMCSRGQKEVIIEAAICTGVIGLFAGITGACLYVGWKIAASVWQFITG